MSGTRLLATLCTLGGAMAQYALLQQYAAGQRQALPVALITLAAGLLGVEVMRRRSVTWPARLGICVLPTTGIAFAALLIAEKIANPAATVLLRPDGMFTVAVFTLLLAGGWLVGLSAFAALHVLRAKQPGTTATH